MSKGNLLTYLLIAVFAISGVFTACKKPDDDKENDKVQLLKSITNYRWEEVFYLNFEYDDKNRITTISYTNQANTFSQIVYQFIYSGNDLVKFIDIERIWEFSKNGNKITAFKDGQHFGEIELNSNGYPIKASAVSYSDTIPITFQYLDNNLAIMSWNGNSSGMIKTFKYDNQKSPIYHCKTQIWFLIYFSITEINTLRYIGSYSNLNNTIEVNTKFWGGVWGEGYETKQEYIYKYDDNGFATKAYRNGELNETFTY